jgi:hypothetical protein
MGLPDECCGSWIVNGREGKVAAYKTTELDKGTPNRLNNRVKASGCANWHCTHSGLQGLPPRFFMALRRYAYNVSIRGKVVGLAW